MYGKIRDGTFWIMDAAALPVQGTETRVNAGNEVGSLSDCVCVFCLADEMQAMEYMVTFQTANQEAGKGEMLRGWYHS
jgi:COP9 signalosome complex subunit 5